MSDLVKVLQHLKSMKFIREVRAEDGYIMIQFQVPIFVLSNYQQFFDEFGYVIKDVMVGKAGITLTVVRK